MFSIVNFLFFQLLWFSAVLGAANDYAWAAPLCLAVFVIFHFTCFVKHRYADILLLALCILLGLVIDSIGSHFGWVEFVYYTFKPITPLWLLCLWAGFALTINHSMRWIKAHVILGGVAGAVFGPLSYYAGWQAGAMQWVEPFSTALFISAAWSLVMPVLSIIAMRISKTRFILQQ